MPFTTDAEWDALQAKVQGWIDVWADRMWLNWWNVHIVWYRGDIPDSNREAVPPGRKALMDCTPDYRYFEATIRVNLERALDFGDDYLENVVIHELAHIVLNEMRDWKPSRKGMKREERVATHFQKIVRELVREKEAALAEHAKIGEPPTKLDISPDSALHDYVEESSRNASKRRRNRAAAPLHNTVLEGG